MNTYMTGIAFYNQEKHRWQDTCLPLKKSGMLRTTKMSVSHRARGFGMTPNGTWTEKNEVHYKDFTTKTGEKQRAYIIKVKKDFSQTSILC